jgi:ATP-dependent Clp protease ATP-binding subunit ClpA
MEFCGGRDANVVRREYAERRNQRVMQTSPQIEQAFVFGKMDAVHRGQAAVSIENLFIGLMRLDEMAANLLAVGGVDLPRMRVALGGRFDLQVEAPAEMTADAECTAVLMEARQDAEQRGNAYLTPLHVLVAILKREPTPVLELIRSTSGSVETILSESERTLDQMG